MKYHTMIHKNQSQLNDHYNVMEVSNMEHKVKRPVVIQDGTHRGVIIEIEYRTEPYEYTDVWVELKTKDEPIRLKYGCPTTVSSESKFGKLLKSFGAKLVPDEMIDDKILIGKECVFLTMTEERDGKKFAKIVENSLKPVDKGEDDVNLV